jgi:hypothetical protein
MRQSYRKVVCAALPQAAPGSGWRACTSIATRRFVPFPTSPSGMSAQPFTGDEAMSWE